MRNKILIVVTILVFIIGMILLSAYLNGINEAEISEDEKQKVKVLEVTSTNFEEEVLNSEKTVVIDFYADWCGPCKVYSPIVESLAAENDDIKVVKINIDSAEDIAWKYQVVSIPTTVVIKNGEEVNRAVGIISRSTLTEMVK